MWAKAKRTLSHACRAAGVYVDVYGYGSYWPGINSGGRKSEEFVQRALEVTREVGFVTLYLRQGYFIWQADSHTFRKAPLLDASLILGFLCLDEQVARLAL